MLWLADECVDAPLVADLRGAGHDVSYIAEAAPSETDSEIVDWAYREGRILLTEDKDFGELAFLRRRPVPGIVLLRIDRGGRQNKIVRLQAAIERFGEGCSAVTQ
jgi:predicted nuclease of predicted toxin-antitoxin system